MERKHTSYKYQVYQAGKLMVGVDQSCPEVFGPFNLSHNKIVAKETRQNGLSTVVANPTWQTQGQKQGIAVLVNAFKIVIIWKWMPCDGELQDQF